RVAQLTNLIQNAGSVSDGSSTVGLDNLLTAGTVTYDVTAGNMLQAEGADLATDILAGLPGSITAGNAAALATDVEDVYRAALDEATSNLKRDVGIFGFVANTVDPKGALDAEIRQLQNDLDKMIGSAASNGKNLLSPYESD